MGFLAELKATGLKDIRNTSILKATLNKTPAKWATRKNIERGKILERRLVE